MSGRSNFQAPEEQDFARVEERLVVEIGKREQGRRRRRRALVASGVTLAVLGGASIAAVTLASETQRARTA